MSPRHYIGADHKKGSLRSSPLFCPSLPEHPTAFTRRRKLPLPSLVALMLFGMRMSVQAELDTFFGHLAGRAQLLRTVSEQAFAQARAKLSLTAIPLLNDWLGARACPPFVYNSFLVDSLRLNSYQFLSRCNFVTLTFSLVGRSRVSSRLDSIPPLKSIRWRGPCSLSVSNRSLMVAGKLAALLLRITCTYTRILTMRMQPSSLMTRRVCILPSTMRAMQHGLS